MLSSKVTGKCSLQKRSRKNGGKYVSPVSFIRHGDDFCSGENQGVKFADAILLGK